MDVPVRLLRYYFPKGTDFRNTSEKEVALVVKKRILDPGSASTTRHLMRCTVRLSVVHFDVEFADVSKMK